MGEATTFTSTTNPDCILSRALYYDVNMERKEGNSILEQLFLHLNIMGFLIT